MTTTFPFERVHVAGEQALATWEEFKTAGRGFPVVIGDDDSVGLLKADFSRTWPNKNRSRKSSLPPARFDIRKA